MDIDSIKSVKRHYSKYQVETVKRIKAYIDANFEKHITLEELSKEGKTIALVGPSGGGKTTVSRLAARFWDASRGRICLGGKDISTIDPETLLSTYAIVFQDVTLFNNTVMENIRIAR